jgi:chromate transporter
MDRPEPDVHRVPFREALAFWVWLGFINFGGPTGQIALMHSELVDRRRWIGEPGFLHALNFAMLLPGPEAHQLAIYVGWLLNGSPGALAAGVFFLLPAFVLMVVLSWVYAVHGDVAWISGTFEGLSWAVVGIVSAALIRIGTRALGRPILLALAVAAFLALFVFGVPFPLVILAAGLVGWVAGSTLPNARPDATDLRQPERVPPTWGRAARVLAIGLAVWLLPLAAVALAAGRGTVLAQEAVFFTVASLVTFGGAYAVLAYVNQAAVVRFGWVTSSEMAVGLSLAETTPGPLILVLVFVGFVGAFRDPGSLPPEVAGLVGALVAAWATFVPSFLWIFLGAPSVERLRGNARLSAALSGITAAVVGVIANLAVVFATSVLFDESRVRTPFGHEIAVPQWSSADLLGIAVAATAFVATLRYRVSVVWVVLAAGAIGLVRSLV